MKERCEVCGGWFEGEGPECLVCKEGWPCDHQFCSKVCAERYARDEEAALWEEVDRWVDEAVLEGLR
jgi:hypothetical protein